MASDDEQFESFVKRARQLAGPFLRDCNDVDPDRKYQDFLTQELYEEWQARSKLDGEVVRELVEALRNVDTTLTGEPRYERSYMKRCIKAALIKHESVRG